MKVLFTILILLTLMNVQASNERVILVECQIKNSINTLEIWTYMYGDTGEYQNSTYVDLLDEYGIKIPTRSNASMMMTVSSDSVKELSEEKVYIKSKYGVSKTIFKYDMKKNRGYFKSRAFGFCAPGDHCGLLTGRIKIKLENCEFNIDENLIRDE